jgi:hypothetical protein
MSATVQEIIDKHDYLTIEDVQDIVGAGKAWIEE